MKTKLSEFEIGRNAVSHTDDGFILLESDRDRENLHQTILLSRSEAYLLAHALLKLSEES